MSTGTVPFSDYVPRSYRGREWPPRGMVALEGGVFAMGSDAFYPEEQPVRRVKVDPFWIDAAPVTNAEFARFVDDTGYVTLAEIAPDPAQYPGLPPELAHPGSLVFTKSDGPVDIHNPANWWRFCLGADWRHPQGPGSSLEGKGDHPVTQVCFTDAQAYARWAGKDLPTEAEWEFAARGGLDGAAYSWGDQAVPEGRFLANFWQGQFPYDNTLEDGFEGTSPVGHYPSNGYGLFDMTGNVWEWTSDWWGLPSGEAPKSDKKRNCCVPANPRGAKLKDSFDPLTPEVKIGRKVLKGGSHLCADNYCHRYRPAARHPQMIDSATTHIGFRCVLRGPSGK